MSTENSSPVDRIDGPEYRQILVPTDDSDCSLLALEHAVALARAFDGRIHAMSVDEGGGSAHADQTGAESEALADAAVAEAARRARARDVPVTVAVRSGSVTETILEYAAEANADVIVMGTHGRSGLRGVIFGSITEATVRKSPVPILTVRHVDDPE